MKVVAITTLGDICMETPDDFINYLDEIITILFSAKDLALIQPEEVKINLYLYNYLNLNSNHNINHSISRMKTMTN